ncbi:nitronate monooxygenase [Arthrobacter sp. CAN_C5]|uniref:NAD(P)H-dependent flavin oxidoreductase n=1 Tax=Arthrobacter sp. CAN_C5 TaxID=2760706 RepID=UPI001AE80C33|nr:nitronate monooxygenase [Arthrobacter sp. CAN_C5]MBP2217040.1 nitronate monooxygenase [Arthrobacter sp. CAN_C5]
MNRLTDLLGIIHPIIQGPFGGGISTVELAAAVSNAGGLGAYGAHILPAGEIRGLVESIRSRTGSPFQVNLWVPQPGEKDVIDLEPHIERLAPLYARLGVEWSGETAEAPDFEEQLEALLDAAPPVLSFVMGLPPQWAIDRAKKEGMLLVGTATTVAEARAVEAAGLDAVVASGSDAGGHRGAFLRPVQESLVGTFSLVPQVVDAVRIPVIAAGGITDRRGVLAAQALGAEGVQIGTGFLATTESGASDVHREKLASPDAETTVLTRLFSGRHARGIVNALIRELGPEENAVPHYPVQNALMQPLRQAAARLGNSDYLNLWAGQAAPLSRAQSAAQYFDSLL